MARALELARRGLYTTHPNPRVGCVIVRDAEIVGEGFHARAGEPHAEIHALRMAGERAKGATAYVTLEPCCHHGRTPPCSDALIAAGVVRVVAAMRDPNPRVDGGGEAVLCAAGLAVEVGVLEEDARALNAGFIRRMSAGLPLVRLKWGASLDGRTALANGQSQWITCPEARRDVQFWRAQSSAILSSAESVITDNARLNVRLTAAELGIEGDVRQPVRVILDRELRLTPDLSIFDAQGEVWIYTASNDAVKKATLAAVSAQIYSAPLGAEGYLDLHWILRDLAGREINDVWIETGARLGGAFVAQGLVDELIVYLAPVLLGHDAHPLVVLPKITELNQAQRWQWQDVSRIGDDVRLILRAHA